MSQPAPGSNIHTIWTQVLTEELLNYSQIKNKIEKSFPDIPAKSFHVHISSLVKKNLAAKEVMPDGQTGFCRISPQQSLLPKEMTKKKNTRPTVPINAKILIFLKRQIGKTFSAGEITKRLKIQGSGAWDIMKSFEREGLLEIKMNGKRIDYLVLPSIKNCIKPPSVYKPNKAKSKPKREVIQASIEKPEIIHTPIQHTMVHNPINEAHDITKLSYGELLSMVVAYREEIMKLKMGIATITQGLLQTGEVEE